MSLLALALEAGANLSSPGSTVGACTKEESYGTIAKAINKVHKDVPEVVCVIENMVSHSSTLLHN